MGSPRFFRLFAAILSLILCLALFACTAEEELPGIQKTFSAKLVKSTSRSEVEVRLKAELVKRYKREHDRSTYYWGYGGTLDGIAADTNAGTNADLPQPPSTATEADSGSATTHSVTNVQEKGVDEGDLVKNDGEYIYLARGSHFFVLQATPANQTSLVSDIDLKEPISELHLTGNRVLVVTTPFSGYGGPAVIAAEAKIAVMPGHPVSRIYSYDIATKATPTLNSIFDIPGFLQGSRRIGNNVYFVTNYTVDIPSPAYAQVAAPYDQNAYETASDRAFAENMITIAETPLEDLLPFYSQTVSGVTTTSPAVDYTDIYFPESGNGTDLALVFIFNLGSDVPTVDSTSVLSSWGKMYMSPESLYLTSDNNWQWIMPMENADQPQSNPEPQTAVHKFSINAAGKPLYRGSGIVDGWVRNSFSLSDFQGYLRIGTTRGGWWGEGLSNQLTILAENGTSLVSKGTISDLAHGEQIYSMRYDGNRGYMVTFRQTDPLFTLDLSDPANPQVAGELKVDGVSTYIHLIGSDRLLTIGRSADATGRTTGNKLQLFDVSSFATPTVLSSLELGEGWSDAIYDHHAFNYFDELKILTIPYYQYGDPSKDKSSYSSGLYVFNIGQNSISQRGIISAPTVTADYGYNYDDTVDRSVIIGSNNSFSIYALAHRSATVANADTLNVITTVTLPESYGYYYIDYGSGMGEPGVVTGGTGTTMGAPLRK